MGMRESHGENRIANKEHNCWGVPQAGLFTGLVSNSTVTSFKGPRKVFALRDHLKGDRARMITFLQAQCAVLY